MPRNRLALTLSLFLRSGVVPEVYTLSSTTMIPKVDSAKHTGDFRPIAVSPVLLRTLHNILAKRVQQSVEFDKKQRAFISTDGCGGEHSHIPGNPKVEPADNPILLYGDDGHAESSVRCRFPRYCPLLMQQDYRNLCFAICRTCTVGTGLL